jgi:prepilin-type processing-associated H-X9-DG protein
MTLVELLVVIAHPSSLNMAMCDGSVQSVSYDIDMESYRRVANRLDGESAADSDTAGPNISCRESHR